MYHTHVGDEFCFPIVHISRGVFFLVVPPDILEFSALRFHVRNVMHPLAWILLNLSTSHLALASSTLSRARAPFLYQSTCSPCLPGGGNRPSFRSPFSLRMSLFLSLPPVFMPSVRARPAYIPSIPTAYVHKSLSPLSPLPLHVAYFRRLVFNDPNDYLLLSYAVLSSHRSC